MGKRTNALLLTPILATAIALPTGSAAGAPDPVGVDDVVIHEVTLTPVVQQRILRYWTPQRMLDAVAPLTSRPRPRRGGLPWPAPPANTAPQRPARRTAPAATSPGALWPAGGAVTQTTGKVFFTLAGRDYLCSASTVTSASRDLVVTAGHCAKDGTGGWAENWIFVPGYRDGTSPYGGYTARRMFVADPWSGDGNGDFDVAMVALSRADGRHVADAVGVQRIAFGRPRGRQTYAVGYPAEGRYDGERLAYCSGRPAGDPRAATTGQGLRCDMTQGSSGGPWLTGFDPATGLGTVTSLSSFKYADDDSTMYGPYFGTAIKRLYDRAQRG